MQINGAPDAPFLEHAGLYDPGSGSGEVQASFTMGERTRLLLLYVMALAPGVVLTGAGVFGHWDAALESRPGTTAAPTSETARQIWQAAAAIDSSPVAPVAPKPTCTDLRALFGLGEALTAEQKLYLQQHC